MKSTVAVLALAVSAAAAPITNKRQSGFNLGSLMSGMGSSTGSSSGLGSLGSLGSSGMAGMPASSFGSLGSLSGASPSGSSTGSALGMLGSLPSGASSGSSGSFGSFPGLSGAGSSSSSGLSSLGSLFGSSDSTTGTSTGSGLGSLGSLGSLFGSSGSTTGTSTSSGLGSLGSLGSLFGSSGSSTGTSTGSGLGSLGSLMDTPAASSSTTDSSSSTAASSTGSSAASGDCKAVTVLFARGTGEPGTLGYVVGPPLAKALAASLGDDKVNVEGVDYPASAAGNADLGASGGKPMAAQANDILTSCPDTKLVLGGYSQGAMVVHNALSAQGLDGSHVAAIVAFGDPFNGQAFQGVDASKVKEFCGSSDSLCARGGANGSGSHLDYGNDATAAAQFIAGIVGQ